MNESQGLGQFKAASDALKISAGALKKRTPSQSFWIELLMRHQISLTLICLALWIEAVACFLPADGNYDLRNYHLYNPFALFHHKWGYDLAPAQAQGFLPPTLDIPYFLLSRRIFNVPILNALLAIPHALAVCLAFLVSLRLLQANDPVTRLIATSAVIFGASGAAGFPLIASTMSDMIGVCLIIGALLLILPVSSIDNAGLPGPCLKSTFYAALMAGGTIGLKLTFLIPIVGLSVALLFLPSPRPKTRLTRLAIWSIGGIIGAGIVGGWWWFHLWHDYANPIFPFYNNIFRSPLVAATAITDPRFLPKTLSDWLLYPALFGFSIQQLVTEPPSRDPRFFLALVSLCWITWLSLFDRHRRAQNYNLFFIVFFVISYLVWETQFSILRYLAGLELLSGTMVAVAASSWTRTPSNRIIVFGGSVVVLGVLYGFTVYPAWGRAQPAALPVALEMPQVEAGGMVLLLDYLPMSYIAVWQDPTVRFIGANNNIVHLSRGEPLTEKVQSLISSQTKQIWGLEMQSIDDGQSDQTLIFYGLKRGSCTQIKSNVDWNLIRMCRLSKIDAPH